MIETGFYQQPSFRPGGFALVIGLHAAAFAGLILIKTDVARSLTDDTIIYDVLPPPEPKQEQPPPERPRELPNSDTQIDLPDVIVPTPIPGPTVAHDERPAIPFDPGAGTEIALADGTPDLPPPVRIEAQLDPRYARDLQPPYPPSEQHAERGGVVRIRVTIGADGRVRAVERLSATSDAFWRATERHALARWRFRPATVDGRPVESTKVMNVTFQMEG